MAGAGEEQTAGGLLQAISLVVLLSVGLTCLLFWPLPWYLTTHEALSSFLGSQVWTLQQIHARVLSGTLFQTMGAEAGYPYLGDVRFLNWPLGLLGMLFQPWLGALGTYNILLLLTPTLTGLGAMAFLRQVTQARPLLCAISSLIYALSPFSLLSMSNGQLEKAQLWIYPLYLLFLYRAIRQTHQKTALVMISLLTLCMTFTCPYFALFLPLVAVPLALGWVLELPERSSAVKAAFVALLMTAGAMYPAYYYYGTAQENPLFRPATATLRDARMPFLQAPTSGSPVAQPADTFLGTGPRGYQSRRPNHTTYLVLPLLLAALVMARRPFPGRSSSLILLGCGGVTAFGPQLVVDHVYLSFQDVPIYLPARILELVGYPLSRGGQYYRAIALASLGLSLGICGGLTTFRPSRALLGGAFLVLVGLLDTYRATAGIWPQPSAPSMGMTVWERWRADTGAGALLALPVQGNLELGNHQLLAAAVSGRATTALPHGIGLEGGAAASVPWVRDWLEVAWKRDGKAARAFLHHLGIRFVVYLPVPDNRPEELDFAMTPGIRRVLQRRGMPVPAPPKPLKLDDGEIRLSLPYVQQLLGEPRAEAGVLYWDLGPAALAPRPKPARRPLVAPPPPPARRPLGLP